MSRVLISITAEDEAGSGFSFPVQAVADRVGEAVLSSEHCPFETEVSLTLTTGEPIRELNRQYRGIDQETDVLSFPNLDYGSPADFVHACQDAADCVDPETGRVFLGDIILNVERVRSQAADYGHSELREYAFLVAHSLFHLCGYDHETPEEAAVMEEKQEAVLQQLGITREAGEAFHPGEGLVTGHH